VPTAKRIVILGGGYAGLSAAAQLASRNDIEVELVDPADSFLHAIQLHKSVYRPVSAFQVPYPELSKKLGFRFRRAETLFDRALLGRWLAQGFIPHDQGRSDFQALILTTGARSLPLARNTAPELLGFPLATLEDVKEYGAMPLIERLLRESDDDRVVTVVGGGATGMQFLFELADCFQGRRAAATFRLLDLEARTLPAFQESFHDYAFQKLQRRGVEYLPGTRFVRQEGNQLVALAKDAQQERSLRSDLTLLFPGVAAHPAPLRTDPFGRVLAGQAGAPLERVFAAGDCSHYESKGLNSATAQAAVRKGRLAADNAVASLLQNGRDMRAYESSALGYFVSLGMRDGVGWMFRESNVLTGIAAYAIKELIESQFDLFLGGLDTYIG